MLNFWKYLSQKKKKAQTHHTPPHTGFCLFSQSKSIMGKRTLGLLPLVFHFIYCIAVRALTTSLPDTRSDWTASTSTWQDRMLNTDRHDILESVQASSACSHLQPKGAQMAGPWGTWMVVASPRFCSTVSLLREPGQLDEQSFISRTRGQLLFRLPPPSPVITVQETECHHTHVWHDLSAKESWLPTMENPPLFFFLKEQTGIKESSLEFIKILLA